MHICGQQAELEASGYTLTQESSRVQRAVMARYDQRFVYDMPRFGGSRNYLGHVSRASECSVLMSPRGVADPPLTVHIPVPPDED